MSRVAWIGLGAMGARMAGRLRQAGHDLVVWNRTRSRADALATTGVQVASTPAEAARNADVVVTMLADPTALREVCEGSDGICAVVSGGTTVIDMSTVGPDAVARLRSALPDDVVLLDAPVLGSLTEADAGTLSLFIGGPADAVQRWTPLLSQLGNPIHVGPTGAGAAAKLVANSALIGTIGLLAETLTLADGLGLPRDVVWQVLDLTPLADQAQRRRPAIESGSHPARFALRLAHKDADLIVAAAESAGRDVRIARAISSWFADADAAGQGGDDYTAVIEHILSSQVTPAPRKT